MKELKTEARIVHKNRLNWTLVFFGAIIVGILFYGLSLYFSLTVVLAVIIFSTILYTTACELATKTMDAFWGRGTFIFPLGSVLAYSLNVLSPKYYYTPEDPHGYSFTFLLYVILMILCFFSCGAGTLIARLVNGYEALVDEPQVISYSIESSVGDTVSLLEDFLDSLNVDYTTVTRKTETFIKFENGSNRYFLFPSQIGDKSVELNFVTFRMKRETLIEPSKEDLDTFTAYLETFLKKTKKGDKTIKWTSDFEPKNAEKMKIQVWENLTSPLQIREKLALRGQITQKILSFVTTHKTAIITFVGGILTVVIGELLLNYLTKIMGI
jgi:hypothetical protein